MRQLSLISMAGIAFFIGCSSTGKPNNENLASAINQYLAQHGKTCTSIGRKFPIDLPASVQQSQYGFGPQLAALQQAGLVSETDTTAVVHGMLDALHGSTPPQPVKRYQLTAEGQKYFQQVPGTFGQTGGLCYGQKAVDSVLRWSNPTTVDGRSQSDVTYTYRIENLAAWAERPEIQQAFPDIGVAVGGASKASQIIGLQLTEQGWQVP